MRDAFLFAVVLVVGAGRPILAQIVTHSPADLGRYFAAGTLVREIPFTLPDPPVAQAVAEAQTLANSLAALSSRVKPGDTISVRVEGGEDVVGTFSHASESSLTLEVQGLSREIPASTVQRVVLQRGGNGVRRGLLTGAPIGALLGSSPCYRVDTLGSNSGHSCGAAVLAGVAIGAGIGAFIGSRAWRSTLVYSARPSEPAAQAQPAVRAPPSNLVASLGDLPSRVQPFDKISARLSGGEKIAGRLLGASDALLTVEVDGRRQAIPASDVQEIQRRGENRAKRGAWVGFLAGAAIADIAVASGSGTEKGAGFVVGTLAGGGAGLVWGALIGAFVHENTVVYRGTAPTVRVMPVLAPGRSSVTLSLQF